MSIEQPLSEPPLRTELHVPTPNALYEILVDTKLHGCDIVELFDNIRRGLLQMCIENNRLIGIVHVVQLPNGTLHTLVATTDIEASIQNKWPNCILHQSEQSDDTVHGLPVVKHLHTLSAIESGAIQQQIGIHKTSLLTRLSKLLLRQQVLKMN